MPRLLLRVGCLARSLSLPLSCWRRRKSEITLRHDDDALWSHIHVHARLIHMLASVCVCFYVYMYAHTLEGVKLHMCAYVCVRWSAWRGGGWESKQSSRQERRNIRCPTPSAWVVSCVTSALYVQFVRTRICGSRCSSGLLNDSRNASVLHVEVGLAARKNIPLRELSAR